MPQNGDGPAFLSKPLNRYGSAFCNYNHTDCRGRICDQIPAWYVMRPVRQARLCSALPDALHQRLVGVCDRCFRIIFKSGHDDIAKISRGAVFPASIADLAFTVRTIFA